MDISGINELEKVSNLPNNQRNAESTKQDMNFQSIRKYFKNNTKCSMIY